MDPHLAKSKLFWTKKSNFRVLPSFQLNWEKIDWSEFLDEVLYLKLNPFPLEAKERVLFFIFNHFAVSAIHSIFVSIKTVFENKKNGKKN